MAIDCARWALIEGLGFIDGLDDDLYSRVEPPMEAIGGHTRHIVDHFNALYRAGPEGWIDYEARARGGVLECSRLEASAAFTRLLQWLDGLDPKTLQKPVTVQVDMGTGTPRLLSVPSCLQRELIFVTSHAIHHYALMAAIARQLGHPVPGDFGKAPSTLHSQATARVKSLCAP